MSTVSGRQELRGQSIGAMLGNGISICFYVQYMYKYVYKCMHIMFDVYALAHQFVQASFADCLAMKCAQESCKFGNALLQKIIENQYLQSCSANQEYFFILRAAIYLDRYHELMMTGDVKSLSRAAQGLLNLGFKHFSPGFKFHVESVPSLRFHLCPWKVVSDSSASKGNRVPVAFLYESNGWIARIVQNRWSIHEVIRLMGSGYFFVQGAMQAMSIESLGSMVQKGATLNFFWSVHVVCNLLDFFPQMFHDFQ